MWVVDIRDLHYAYPAITPGIAPAPVLRGVDLQIAAGEFVSLMGRTGAGKSTLCMAMSGLVPQATGGVIRGVADTLGVSARYTPVNQLAARVGTVYQDPESQLFCTSVADEVAFGPENLGLARQQVAEQVEWALDVVSMSHLRDRSPVQLSGGQKQRVAIAAALAMLPELLILDEPTSGLDPLGKSEVFGAVDSLCKRRKMTIVLASQDAERVAAFSDRVVVLEKGRITADGPPAQVFSSEAIWTAGLAPPQVARIAEMLNVVQSGHHCFCTVDEAEAALRAHWVGAHS